MRTPEAHEAVLQGRWDVALAILDHLIAEAEAGGIHYLEPTCRALRASIDFAREELDLADEDSEKALESARRTMDPQILAPVLAVRAIVQFAEGRREEASKLASEVLGLGAVPLMSLLEAHPAATPIEFAWLLRDLGREFDLLAAFESAPSTVWFEAARAIAEADFAKGLELVERIGAPSIAAYTRLRTAQELARAGDRAEARDCLAPALAFFRKVGATRYLAQAEQVLAPSA